MSVESFSKHIAFVCLQKSANNFPSNIHTFRNKVYIPRLPNETKCNFLVNHATKVDYDSSYVCDGSSLQYNCKTNK